MTIETTISSVRQRFFSMNEVLQRIGDLGIAIDEETIEYHLYKTRKMPKPSKKVKRERYWTAEQIEQFVSEL